jgi:mono/diheme cytochrome c family protein
LGAYLRKKTQAATLVLLTALSTLFGCEAERRKSDAELGLNPRQAAGRRVFDAQCARCHAAYSSRALQGPTLRGVLTRQYLPSGVPANDERVADVIRLGRGKMPGYSRVLNDQQINDLIVYLHTL